jgi:hypothetical protein
MNAKVTELMETIGISRQAAIEMVALSVNAAREEKRVPCSVYTRTVGYYATVDSMHKGKQEEFMERKEYKINEASLMGVR